jgi:CRISPR/Cas system endoribonuclease Cas6 (RAMP superfamily)
VAIRGKKATGFVSWGTYKMKDKKSGGNKTTSMLAKYTEYANIDGNKTGGFGVFKILF